MHTHDEEDEYPKYDRPNNRLIKPPCQKHGMPPQ